MELLVVHTVFS